ncbi:MAG: 3-deoxy-manno-octulosonate cytidylyltransferase [Bacteroidetes bacterium]|nr:3-deoxy-manno-octulosonate cytidylyltransferase [Bacteroidota bacterium]
MSKKILGIIPARYASSRFPGKPLAKILGKTMLQRVIEQSKKSQLLHNIIVATDNEEIKNHAQSLGVNAIITSEKHPSGTDRCYEAYTLLNEHFDYILNIQGDEPFLDPQQINSLLNACNGNNEILTQMIKCNSSEVLFDAGEVKITLDTNSNALYFSRAVIPHLKGIEPSQWHLHFPFYRHVGMYAYRSDILKKITSLQQSNLEKAESLEQLRWLENGFKIKCVETTYDSHCIDTPQDIEKVIKLMGIAQ